MAAPSTLRSDRFTQISQANVIYSDITDNLDVHPDTGDLFRVTNVNDVKRALKHIILTDKYERFYNPTFGVGIKRLLFENITTETNHFITKLITDSIQNFEPRVNILQVLVDTTQGDNNQVNISVSFTFYNVPQPQLFNLTVERVR